MRLPASPAAALVAPVLVAAVLAGCAGESSEEASGPAVGTPGPTQAEPSTRAEPDLGSDDTGDTFADVAEPASVPLDADLADGVEAISVWEGAELLEEPGRLGGELFLSPGRSLVLFLTSTTGVLAEDTSEAAMEYWKRSNFVTEGPIEDLDPVVVDGVEMLRARGGNEVMVADVFVLSSEDVSIEILFTTPTDWEDDLREERIAQVMATVDLE